MNFWNARCHRLRASKLDWNFREHKLLHIFNGFSHDRIRMNNTCALLNSHNVKSTIACFCHLCAVQTATMYECMKNEPFFVLLNMNARKKGVHSSATKGNTCVMSSRQHLRHICVCNERGKGIRTGRVWRMHDITFMWLHMKSFRNPTQQHVQGDDDGILIMIMRTKHIETVSGNVVEFQICNENVTATMNNTCDRRSILASHYTFAFAYVWCDDERRQNGTTKLART